MNSTRLIFVTTVATLLPFVASLFYFVLFGEHPAAPGIYSATKFFTLIWPLIAFKAVLREKIPPIRISAENNRTSVMAGIASGVLISMLLLVAYRTVFLSSILAAVPKMSAKVVAMGIGSHYIAFALFLAFFHSLLEEYYWRWFVFSRLRHLCESRILAHVLAALAFSLHHIVIATQFFSFPVGVFFGLSVGVGGVVWSVLYDRTGSLLASWISHAIVDVTILSVGYRLLYGA